MDPDERLAALLLVGPGAPPLRGQAWLRRLVLGRPAPGGWGLVSTAMLPELGAGVAAGLAGAGTDDGVLPALVLDDDGRVLARATSEALYLEAMDRSLERVAARLDERGVREDPRHADVVAVRVRRDGGDAVIDVAPALDQDGWLARAIGVDLDSLRLGVRDSAGVPEWEPVAPGPVEPEFGLATVTVGGASVDLPAASLSYAFEPLGPPLASLELTTPSHHWDGVPTGPVRMLLEAR